jgi:phage internal scaffolding protein
MDIKDKHVQKPNQKYILRKNGSLKISSLNSEPSLTQQQFKAECDINNIIKSYSQTGVLPVSTKVGKFLDVSNVTDYQTSLNTVYQAQKAFDDLPSKIRTRFKNDPNELLAFIEDDKNHEEALQLGLLSKTATSKIIKPITETPIPQK